MSDINYWLTGKTLKEYDILKQRKLTLFQIYLAYGPGIETTCSTHLKQRF